MTPSARLQAVIEIVQQLENTAQPADLTVRSYFRRRRYAGSGDRAWVADRVYAILRQKAAFSWRMGDWGARSLAIGALLAEGQTPAEIAVLFDGSAYGPAPLDTAECHALANPPAQEPPAWGRGNYPAWLHGELVRAFGEDLPTAMAAMQGRAAIDLRVNRLKTTREALRAELAGAGFDAVPTPFSSCGLRLPPGGGAAKLGTLGADLDGGFEFQDEAAQIAALLCGARPGLRVLDLAAGTGGKSLALAAEMQNQGEIVADDIVPARLRQLAARAERAGAGIVRCAAPEGAFDIVLVDAPCSGSGTWRRQPELRWRLTPERLAELTTIQDGLLERAAGFLAPGGRLVYATCSLLRVENQDRIERFLSHHPGFAVTAASSLWAGPAVPGMGEFFLAAPHVCGTDGFFAAVLQAGRWTSGQGDG